MRTPVICLALVALGILPAHAQTGGQAPDLKAKGPAAVGPKVPGISEVLKTGQARAAGCIKQQLYNIQSVNQMSVSFTLDTAEGDRLFNLESTEIRHVPAGSALPISTTAEMQRWTRLLDTLERAGSAGKPLLVDHETPSGDVFAIYIQWSGSCPTG